LNLKEEYVYNFFIILKSFTKYNSRNLNLFVFFDLSLLFFLSVQNLKKNVRTMINRRTVDWALQGCGDGDRARERRWTC